MNDDQNDKEIPNEDQIIELIEQHVPSRDYLKYIYYYLYINLWTIAQSIFFFFFFFFFHFFFICIYINLLYIICIHIYR